MIVYMDYTVTWVRVNLDRFHVMMAGYWKLNAPLFDEKNFQQQLLLIGNKWRDLLKFSVKSFAADFKLS